MTTVCTLSINSLADVYELSNSIQKGIIKMPNASKLARKIKTSPYKVRQALKGNIPKKTRIRTKYLDTYRDDIINYLSAEEHKNRQFDYILHLFEFCKEKLNINCCYTTFRNYILKDPVLKKYYKESQDSHVVRFETKAGQQAQFDFKENVEIAYTDNTTQKVHFATMTLGYSRYTVRVPLLEKTVETVLRTWAMMFQKLGGVPKKLVIDNIPGLVQIKGNKRMVHPKAIEFAKNYGFEFYLCKPRRPETKGKVETKNKRIERIKNYNGEYRDLYDVVTKCDEITENENNSICQGTNEFPLLMYGLEKKALNALPKKSISDQYYNYFDRNAKVQKDCLFSYKGMLYSVPKQYINKRINIQVYYEYIHIYYNNNLVTIHKISEKKLNIDPKHELSYTAKPKSILENEKVKTESNMKEFGEIKYDNISTNNG